MSSQQNYQEQYQKLLIQRQVFQTALANAPADRKADYQSALTFNSSQIAALERSQQLPAQTFSPLPPEPTANIIQQGGTTWQKVNSAPAQPARKTSNSDPVGFFKELATNPVPILTALINPVAKAKAKDNSPAGTVFNVYIGAAGEILNQYSGVKDAMSNVGKKPLLAPSIPLVNSIPNPNAPKVPFSPQSETQQTGQTIFKVSEALVVAAVAPVLGPVIGVSSTSVLVGEGLSVGINQVFKGVQGGGLLTPEEIAVGAAQGGVFTIIGGAVFRGAGRIAPSIVASRPGRVGIGAGLGGGISYITSGGNLEETGKGALFGGALVLGTELIGVPLYNKLRSTLPTKYGGAIRLTLGEPTIGASGEEVPTYVSDKLKVLGGKRLRIVGDVTENPVGSDGVTLKSLVGEYTGKNVPTAHATLTPEQFNLKVGGETLLKGYPELSKGFRSSQQLHPFYSAPGSEEFVTVYGGYAGIGEGYSGSSPKIVFNGKPTALITLETKVSPEFLRLPNENQAVFLNRITSLSGKTGISSETLLGYSMERQLSTPTAYNRFGVDLPGSRFISEGKVGIFQIKSLPSGKIGKIPIIRDMFAEYTSLAVVKGSYGPTKAGEIINSQPKILDVGKYNENYGSKIKVTSPFSVGLNPSRGFSFFSRGKNTSSSESSSSSFNSSPSKPLFKSNPSLPSFTPPSSKPSKPSYPSYTPGKPSYPSYNSKPFYPSYNSRTVSSPSYPSSFRLSSPFLFGGGGGERREFNSKQSGVWFRRTHAIPNPDKVLNQVLGKRKSHRKQNKSNIRIKINVRKR